MLSARKGSSGVASLCISSKPFSSLSTDSKSGRADTQVKVRWDEQDSRGMYVRAGTVAPLSTSRAAAQDWSTSTSISSAVRSAGVSALSNFVRSTLSPRNAQFSGVRSSCELRYRFRGEKEVMNVTAKQGTERAVD